MATPWHLAPALERLRQEVNTLCPDRDRRSDGTIGDQAHQGRASDHNPDRSANNIVRAWDVDKDLGPNLDVAALVEQLMQDDRVAYLISRGRIWQNPDVFKNGGWQAYSGPNGHFEHLHISLRRGSRWDSDARPWGIRPKGASAVAGRPIPTREDSTTMYLWHTVAPWGEHIYGYTTESAGAGTLDVNVFQHLAHIWPNRDVPFDPVKTEIEQAWRRAGIDDEKILAKLEEMNFLK